MTLDEAILHAEEVANANERLCETAHPAMQLSDYGKCAEEHRQLAEWLKELKRLKEQEPKTGHWIVHERNGISYLECSECLRWYLEAHLLSNSYCPNCGSNMIEPREREE